MDKTHNQRGKSSAKSYGLNAVLVANNEDLLLTRGDDTYSKVEQAIGKNNEPKFYNPSNEKEQSFKADASGKQLSLKPKDKEVVFKTDNPIFNDEIGKDALGFKPKLEMEMFNKEYPNDNIHVQIAYHVLDIKKILGLKLNDVIFCLRNLQRWDEASDLVGSIRPENSWERLEDNQRRKDRRYIDNLRPYAIYFDNVFKFENKGKDGRNTLQAEKNYSDNYKVLRILSYLRQSCVHGNPTTTLFDIANDKSCEDLVICADDLLKQSIKELNDGFCKNSDRTFLMLFRIFETKMRQEKDEIIKAYYKYIVYRDDKNIGISLKTIREMIVDKEIRKLYTIQSFSNERAMLNKLLDYVLYTHYSSNKAHVNDIIKELVACQKRTAGEEDPRLAIYEKEAMSFITNNPGVISRIKNAIAEYGHLQPFKVRNNAEFNVKEIIEQVTVDQLNLSPFAKFIYVVCRFLDGKEVNELTTSLCNKFENMVSLVRAAKTVGVWDDWSDKYSLFNRYSMEDLANQFRLVKTLASKKRKLKKIADGKAKRDGGAANAVTRSLWADAFNIFKDNKFVSYNSGDNADEDKAFEELWDKLHDQKATKDNKGKINATEASKARNLIKNCIINNRRFVYLMKFFDPRKCRKLITNKEVVKYVFSREEMPASQIVRYYAAITKQPVERLSDDKNSIKIYASKLVDELANVDLNTILQLGANVFHSNNRNPNDYEVQKARQLVSLYLTVLYVIVKGLVHTNSIYALGWSAFDRDYFYRLDVSDSKKHDYLALTNSYLEDICPPVIDDGRTNPENKGKPVMFEGKPVYRNSRVRNYLLNNIDEAKRIYNVFRQYRNKTEHNDLVASLVDYIGDIKYVTSYYDIYQYGLQRYFTQFYADKDHAKEIRDMTRSYKPNDDKLGITLLEYLDMNHRYQKNFVKVINMPFAYCMSRYKNLTIANLFNDKYGIPREE